MIKKNPDVVNVNSYKTKSVQRTGNIIIDYGVSTHIGRRPQNQDAVRVTSAQTPLYGKGRIFAVADGMGGHLGGSLASCLACDGLNEYYEKMITKKNRLSPADTSHHLVEVIMRLDRHIRLQGLKDTELEDMGTTLSCLVITDSHSIIAHVGDSRIYRLRNNHLACLTVDHTFVNDMIFEGEVDPDKAHLHPLRHMLTRALGTGEQLELVDARIDRIRKNDCFLLCTDGLHNAVTDKRIVQFLSAQETGFEAATKLVNQALENGARDNITAVVIKLSGWNNIHPADEE